MLYNKILPHVGHRIEAVTYGADEIGPINAAIECHDCHEIIVDEDRGDDRY